MTAANSPMYALGHARGEADNAREAAGKPLLGPEPPNPDYPWMYLKGYESARGGE